MSTEISINVTTGSSILYEILLIVCKTLWKYGQSELFHRRNLIFTMHFRISLHFGISQSDSFEHKVKKHLFLKINDIEILSVADLF